MDPLEDVGPVASCGHTELRPRHPRHPPAQIPGHPRRNHQRQHRSNRQDQPPRLLTRPPPRQPPRRHHPSPGGTDASSASSSPEPRVEVPGTETRANPELRGANGIPRPGAPESRRRATRPGRARRARTRHHAGRAGRARQGTGTVDAPSADSAAAHRPDFRRLVASGPSPIRAGKASGPIRLRQPGVSARPCRGSG